MRIAEAAQSPSSSEAERRSSAEACMMVIAEPQQQHMCHSACKLQQRDCVLVHTRSAACQMRAAGGN